MAVALLVSLEWWLALLAHLRAAVHAVAPFEELVKWWRLVCLSASPTAPSR